MDSRLIGRESDLKEISETLQRDSTLVPWVHGSSGTGKSALVEALGHRVQRKLGWRVLRCSLRWSSWLASCSSLAQFLEEAVKRLPGAGRVRRPAARPDSVQDTFEGPLQETLKQATRSRPLLMILDGLDEVDSDAEGKRDLMSLCSVFRDSPQAHLLATSRKEALYGIPEIGTGTVPHPLGGLPLPDFRKLARHLHLGWSEQEAGRIHDLVGGLPLAPVLFADLSQGDSRQAIGNLDAGASSNPLFALHQAVLETKLAKLDDGDHRLVREILCLLAAAQERLRPEDIVRYLSSFSLTPHSLQSLLSRAQLAPLFFPGGATDPGGVALLHASFRDFLTAEYFTAAEISSAHRRIARTLDPTPSAGSETPHLLTHLARGWPEDRAGLDSQLSALDWSSFFLTCIREPAFHRADLLRGLKAVRRASPELLVKKVGEATDHLLTKDKLKERDLLLFLKLACNLARPVEDEPFLKALPDSALRPAEHESRGIAIKKEELRGHLRSAYGPRKSLRLLLDLWPGYYPLFAVQEELKRKGIRLDIVESSAVKNEILLARGADLIASTPGCILALPTESLRTLRVIGVPNRSAGADKILVDRRKIALTPGPAPRLEKPAQLTRARLVATAESTSQMFLNLFLEEHGLDPSNLQISVCEEYFDVLDRVKDEKIDVISTWEPYASHLAKIDGNFIVVYDSSREPAVIYDLLVTHRDSFGSAEEGDKLAALGRLYDDAVARDLARQDEIERSICYQFGLLREVYRQGLAGVKLFRRDEMVPFFQPGSPENLRSICERVARIWRRPDQVDANGNLRAELSDALDAFLGSGPPAWLIEPSLQEEAGPSFEYDVALSYAGEDRVHAEALASRLKQLRYRVFYDQDHIAEFWGKNRAKLHEIYSRKARFCVVFASESYLKKPWTKVELEAVQERDMEDPEPGYLLVVSIDGSRLPGISNFRIYVSIQKGIDFIADTLDKMLTKVPG
jgi:hypothetical protein